MFMYCVVEISAEVSMLTSYHSQPVSKLQTPLVP